MSTRQDAWTKDEDLLLAETVLRYIREGKTQMKAFEEVGHRLSRTPQACGFRWNANLRKHYKKAIELAKQSRKKLNDQPISFDMNVLKSDEHNQINTFDQVIRQLEILKDDYFRREEHRTNGNSNDVQELKIRLSKYEQFMDDIYNKIDEFKKEFEEK